MKLSQNQSHGILPSIALALIALEVACFGDTVILRDGKPVPGVIESQTNDGISIRTQSGLVSFPAASVREVRRSPPQENALHTLTISLSAGELNRSMTIIDRLKNDKAALQSGLAVLLQHGEHFVQRAPTDSPADAQQFTVWLRAYTPANAALSFMLARYLAARGETDAAVNELSALPAPVREQPAVTQFATQLLQQEAQRSATTTDPQQALARLTALAELAPRGAGVSAGILIALRQAERMAESSQFRQALEVIAAHVAPFAPATAWNAANDILESASKLTSGTALLGLYDLIAERITTGPMEGEFPAIQERRIAVLMDLGRYDEAETLAHQLSISDADRGARMLHLVEYERRLTEVAPDDALALYRLATWARDMGLVEEAAGLFRRAAREPQLKENAELQLRLLSTSGEKQSFDELNTMFRDGHYADVVKKAEAFQHEYPQSEFCAQAAALGDLARFTQTREKDIRPAEADVVYQNAERLFYQDKHQEALEEVNRLQADYPGTPAARKADTLRKRIDHRVRDLGLPPLQARVASTTAPVRREAKARAVEEVQTILRSMSIGEQTR